MEAINQMKSIKRKPRKGPWWDPLDFFELPCTIKKEEDDDSDFDYDFYDISDSNFDDDDDSSWCYVGDDSFKYVKVIRKKKVYAPTVENVNHYHKDDNTTDDDDDDNDSPLSSQLQTQAAQQFRMPDMESVMEKQDQGAIAGVAQPEEDEDEDEDEDEEEEEEVDETGVHPHDIDLIVAQTEVSRSKAIKTLQTHGGDIVGAIMELTS